MVVAGPGSGKTELLGMRVANILQKTDTPASSILCITFTDAASANMRQRLTGLIGQTAYDVCIHTFHSLGTEIIQRYSDYFYDGADVLPADDIMTLEVITEILKELPKSNPLASFHQEQGYVHARKVISAISDIKRGALTPELFQAVVEDTKAFQEETLPLLQSLFADKITKKSLDLVPAFVKGLDAAHYGNFRPLPTMHTLKERLMMDLKPVLEAESTKPLTEWKRQYTEKDERNQTVWKELKHYKKYAALAYVYNAYQEALKRRALVDFNDMLMRVVEALKTFPDLRFTLQERFLYILIDEFQDTNGIQLELVRLLSQTDDAGFRPNILAVGDDDQAIYKFQGADVDNLLGFRDLFPDPEYVVLDKNYRSTQAVLDAAEEVINESEERLAHILPDLFTKHLTAANESLSGGAIECVSTASEEEEAILVADQIATLLEEGVPSKEIAILGRNHAHVQTIARTLTERGISYIYDRSNNVLDSAAVTELLDMLEFSVSLINPFGEPRDDILARILSQPCWALPSLTIWKLSHGAFASRQSWIEAMQASDDVRLRHIALYFIEVSRHAQTEPVESIFDLLTGSHEVSFEDGEETIQFTAPFKNCHFPGAEINEEQLQLLAELRGLMSAIRTYLPKELVLAKDFITNLQLHRQYGISISADEQLLQRRNGLTIMTVHKAKGLEFDHVFMVQCTQDAWNKRRGGNGDIALPKFLGLRAQPETESDFRKLFFVALTRAKRFIHMSFARANTKGKEMVPLRYLTGMHMPEIREGSLNLSEYVSSLELSPAPILTSEDRNFLADILENYALSATHLNSFLNIANGGPQQFILDHILRYPSRKQPAASFGTAMHCTLEGIHRHLREYGEVLPIEAVEELFTHQLSKERLSREERSKYLEHGKEQLRIYIHERGSLLDPTDIVERNFRSDQVRVGTAAITGKIDKMHFDNDARTIEVFDWKTGKALRSWQGKYEFEKHKLWAYRNQLMFYKLLVEQAPHYRGRYVVTTGTLEFLEHRDGEILSLSMQFSHEEMQRFARLVEAVYQCITTQNFPDISNFSPDLAGTEAFAAFLLGEEV